MNNGTKKRQNTSVCLHVEKYEETILRKLMLFLHFTNSLKRENIHNVFMNARRI